MSVDFEAKICTVSQAKERVAILARPLVFTNGVFDVLHRGHVTYLAQARALGAALVVGVNSDASVRRLGKGADRPVNDELDRAAILAALSSVDLVTIFEQDTPYELIEFLHPDVLVKGGDYDMARLRESALVQSWGGRVEAIPFRYTRSTSETLRRIRQSAA